MASGSWPYPLGVEFVIVDIKREGVSLVQGPGEADVELAMDGNSWAKLLSGGASAVELMVNGKLRIRGRPSALVKLLTVLEKYGVKGGIEGWGVWAF